MNSSMKTITLDEDAYERLKSWKQPGKDSFSAVVKRVVPRAGNDRAEVGRFLALGLPLDDTAAVVPAYARIAAALQEAHPDAYREIGQNDLWIAAVAVRADLPLLTRNRRHFDRIDGLSLHLLKDRRL